MSEEIEDVYAKSQKDKNTGVIELLRAKPENWTEQERKVYKNLTLIDFLPTNRMLFIKELEYTNETESGILMVHSEEQIPLTMGMAVSIAPDCRFGQDGDGNVIKAAQINAGDIISYAVYNGTEYYIGGQKFFLINDLSVFGKVPDSTVAKLIAEGDRTDHMWTIRAEMTYDNENPNNIGPKSPLHVDNYANKKKNERDKAAEGGGITN